MTVSDYSALFRRTTDALRELADAADSEPSEWTSDEVDLVTDLIRQQRADVRRLPALVKFAAAEALARLAAEHSRIERALDAARSN